MGLDLNKVIMESIDSALNEQKLAGADRVSVAAAAAGESDAEKRKRITAAIKGLMKGKETGEVPAQNPNTEFAGVGSSGKPEVPAQNPNTEFAGVGSSGKPEVPAQNPNTVAEKLKSTAEKAKSAAESAAEKVKETVKQHPYAAGAAGAALAAGLGALALRKYLKKKAAAKNK